MDKIPGERNVADHFTKGKSVWEVRELLEGVGAEMKVRSGIVEKKRVCEVREIRREKGWQR